MSDLDIFEELEADEAIEFPAFEPGTSRSTIYRTGKTTRFEIADADYDGAIQLRSARLTRIRARRQKNSKTQKMDLVNFVEIVVDETLAKVDEAGNLTELIPYTDARFANWQDRSVRPHRVYGQNWGADPVKVMELVNFCRQNYGFRVTKNPPMNTRENSDYPQQIQWLFDARPSTPIMDAVGGRQDWSNYGGPVAAFEVRVNPDYEAGFQNFADGVVENLKRVIEARKITDPEERADALSKASRFSGSITGITEDEEGRYWAKNCDLVTIALGTEANNREFRIWNPGQDSMLVDEDLTGSNQTNGQPADHGDMTLDEFDLPKKPAPTGAVAADEEPF